MKNIVPVVGINLLVLLGYSLWIHQTSSESDRGLGIMIRSAFFIVVHTALNLGISGFYYARNNNTAGKAWVLSACVVLLIGFSTCLGTANL